MNNRDDNRGGGYVLYWMIASRRTRWNYALQHACEQASRAGVGVVVLEALRVGYQWASDRIHRFVIEGMGDNCLDLADSAIEYIPYIEPSHGAGKGLLEALASRALRVVTDDYPCFFLPRMVAAAGRTLPVRLEAVDSNGLYPIAQTDRVFTTAASFRRHLQKELPPHLLEFPMANPCANLKLPKALVEPELEERWPRAQLGEWLSDERLLKSLPIDHTVAPLKMRGGAAAAGKRLDEFVRDDLGRYGEQRNHPDEGAASGLSPYLHFGHLSAHEVFAKVVDKDGWDPSRIAAKATGSRSGWWGASSAVESFLDELITWREIGFNMTAKRADYADFESLPEWAKTTLREHEGDVRDEAYTLEQLAAAQTDDEIWNAAQRQLVREGVIHNYLRMLWGKKILGWAKDPETALSMLIELNNRYAIDGRDPNSYSGIFWVLGRYDRAWGPERSVFGKVRYMTSDSTRRKLRLRGYLNKYGPT